MAATQSLRVILDLQALAGVSIVTGGPGGGPRMNVLGMNRPFKKRYTSGFGAGQIDKQYFKRNPTAIAASGNQDFDLAGSLADDFGTTITMAKFVGAWLFNFNTAGTLTLRMPAANGLVGAYVAASDGSIAGKAQSADEPGITCIWHPQGLTVTAGTGDLLNVVNNDASNAADYAILLVGRSQ